MIASGLGNIDIVKLLINKNAKVTRRDSFGKTALIFAI